MATVIRRGDPKGIASGTVNRYMSGLSTLLGGRAAALPLDGPQSVSRDWPREGAAVAWPCAHRFEQQRKLLARWSKWCNCSRTRRCSRRYQHLLAPAASVAVDRLAERLLSWRPPASSTTATDPGAWASPGGRRTVCRKAGRARPYAALAS